jgi:tetratricopeptide (TPR) repeat protein
MKKLFAVLVAVGLAAVMASAQSLNEAKEAFNNGVEAMETNKAEALAKFQAALEIANQCTEEEDAAEFIGTCKTAITGAMLSIAKEQINEDAYDEAVATLDQAKATAADFGQDEVIAEAEALIPNVYMRKGATLLKNKDFKGAAEAFKNVVSMKADDAQAYLLLGQAQMQAGIMDGAIEALTKANELGEANAAKLLSSAYLREGQALLKAGKNLEAVEALEKSNSYVESANAYKLIANAYTKAGKSAKSIEAYKKYLTVSPNAKDAADIMFTIAATAQKAGDKATATEYYKKLAGTKYAEQAEAQLKTLK